MCTPTNSRILSEIRHAPRHIFEPGVVRFVVRNKDDVRSAAGHRLDLLREVHDGDFAGVADVEDLSDGARLSSERDEAGHHIGDVRERSRLPPVAKNGDRLVGERLTNEIRNDHAVSPRLARTDSVEQTHDDHRQLAFAVIRQREKFVESFAARVRPSVLGRWTGHEISVFLERHGRTLAVHLRRRKDDDGRLLLLCVLQHDFRAVHVRLDRVDGRFNDKFDAHGGRQVKHDVDAIDERRHDRVVHDVVDDVFKSRLADEPRDVAHGAGRQIVERDDLVPLRQQPFRQV